RLSGASGPCGCRVAAAHGRANRSGLSAEAGATCSAVRGAERCCEHRRRSSTPRRFPGSTMNLLFALSPLLAVAGGALLLMLAEALGRPAVAAGVNAEGLVTDAGAGRAPELAVGSSVVLFCGAILSIGVWLYGPDKLSGLDAVAPYFIVDRFSLFFAFVICLGGALAALL